MSRSQTPHFTVSSIITVDMLKNAVFVTSPPNKSPPSHSDIWQIHSVCDAECLVCPAPDPLQTHRPTPYLERLSFPPPSPLLLLFVEQWAGVSGATPKEYLWTPSPLSKYIIQPQGLVILQFNIFHSFGNIQYINSILMSLLVNGLKGSEKNH